MPVGKVTVSALRGLQGWLWDTYVTGFGARRQTNGVFYYVRYRHNGAQVVRSLGRHGPLTPDTARAKARQLLGVVAGGTDPFAQSLSGKSVGPTIDRYLERKKAGLKASSFARIEHYLRHSSAPLHSLRLAQIDRRKIAALLGEIEAASGPITRNRARTTLSSFFSWCVSEGLIDINPVAGTAKADEGGSRERVLTPEELRQLWRGLRADAFSNIIRLLLLTGQRRTEIGDLQWSEIDRARKQIMLGAGRTKNSREHSLPLSTQALAILDRLPRRNSSGFIFGARGFNSWASAKIVLDQRLSRMVSWRLHDLRRTCATQMAELGVQPHIIEAVLNHVSGHKSGVAGIYNRASYADAMRDALQRRADHLDQITTR
jgi:integrase